MKGDSAVPHKNGKATNSIPDQTKPKKKVFQQKQASQKPKESMWATRTSMPINQRPMHLDKV